MLNSIAEGYIQRFCGRYLKNFSSENVSVGVTGTITLTNIQIRVEELLNFQLPYKPVSAFIGTLYADLPLVLGGNFDIRVSDVLVVAEKNPDDIERDPAVLHKALQMWIGAFYFSLAQADAIKGGVSSSDIEYSHRLFDRLCLTLENIHFRVEEIYTAHIPPPIGKELLCAGVMIKKLELRPPTYAELSEDGSTSSPSWQTNATSKVLVVNKLLQCIDLNIYCAREEGYGSTPDADINLKFVRSANYQRKSGNVVGPATLAVKFSAAYQKANQVFGPLNAAATGLGFDFRVTDEQMAYISSFARTFDRHLHKMQLQSRIAFSSSTAEASRRAQMRWGMIRECIKSDWYRYSSTLEEGTIRWRSWFEVWRLAARYVALREILLYHVGFEASPDPSGETVTYSISESLLADHHRFDLMSKSTEELPTAGTLTKKQRRRYQGTGAFAPSAIQSAEMILKKQIRSSGIRPQPGVTSSDFIDPLSLSPSAIRSLYALQLEMDTMLPIKIAALCRLWSEERYRLKRASSPAGNLSDPEAASSSGAIESAAMSANSSSDSNTTTLLIAVVDCVNLRGTFGVSKVDAYCSLRTCQWQGYSSTLVTETVGGKVGTVSGTAFVSWGDIFSLPISPTHATDEETTLRMECNSRGFFSPSYGKAWIQRKTLLENYLTSRDGSNSELETQIATHHFSLTNQAGGLFAGDNEAKVPQITAPTATSDPEEVSVRLLSMVVTGSPAVHAAAHAKFSVRVKEAMAERRQVLERQQQLAEREANRDGEEEEEVFILDPSVLTVQDLNLSLRIPKLSLIVDLVYLTPPELRANLQSSNSVLAHSSFVPVVSVELRGIYASLNASNNPWIIRGNALCNSFKVRELHSRKGGRTIISLPKMTAVASVTQTSTMGRSIDGALDASCFDWSGNVTMGPFKVQLHPRSFQSSTRGNSNSIWKSYRILNHLWLPKASWAMGCAFSSMGEGGGMPPQRHAEAGLRLGNSYIAFPKHINVLNEVLAAIRHTTEENNAEKTTLPSQISTMTYVTETRAMDFEVNFKGSEGEGGAEGWELNEEDFYSDDEGDDASSSKVASSADASGLSGVGLFGWMAVNTVVSAGLSGVESVTNVVGVSSRDDTSANKAELEKQRRKAKKSAWIAERNRLEARIRSLEEKNSQLEFEIAQK